MTSTDKEGRYNFGSCHDWTGDPEQPGLPYLWSGLSSSTSFGWSYHKWTFCSSGSLACLERIAGPELPQLTRSGRLAFVTSVEGTGDFSSWPDAEEGLAGLDAADSVCRNLAASAGLPFEESFKAWLSDDSMDAIDRFEHDGPWVRIDGVPIAQNKEDLVSGSLFSSIEVTELGDYASDSDVFSAWTGSDSSGQAHARNCSSWTDGTEKGLGLVGVSVGSGHQWTSYFSDYCNVSRSLYCLSDIKPMVFANRFE